MVDERSSSSSLNERIAQRVRDLRAARGWPLEALAHASGISRSMISVIERGESSPTAVVLEKLAAGLGVPLASLFDSPGPANDPVSRAKGRARWRDPHSGYVRSNVSPGGAGSPIRIVEVRFPPRARVSYETGPREPLTHQQVWVLGGAIDVTWGDELFELGEGDCAAMALDRPISFHNPHRKTARYAVVLATPRR
jgi:transcriptional regulator with XRE-family HTH domain